MLKEAFMKNKVKKVKMELKKKKIFYDELFQIFE